MVREAEKALLTYINMYHNDLWGKTTSGTTFVW